LDFMIVQWHGEKYQPLWRCIYCGEAQRNQLTDEHIIPFGLLPKGGDWFLPKSSCYACADITKKFEGQVLSGMFGPFRQQLKLKSCRESKKTGRMALRRGHPSGQIWEEEISVTSFPKLCIGFRWPIPGILLGEAPTNQFQGRLIVKGDTEEMRKLAPEGQGFRIGTIGPLHFARMLAKIAHSYAIAKYGTDSFNPLLPPLIKGENDLAPYLIGGDASAEPPDQPNVLHDIFRVDSRRDNGPTYLGVAVRLFAMVGMPRYHIIVGRRLKEGPASEKSGDTIAVQLPITGR
jgi:hypothetical protein